jgi:hypothetical protein
MELSRNLILHFSSSLLKHSILCSCYARIFFFDSLLSCLTSFSTIDSRALLAPPTTLLCAEFSIPLVATKAFDYKMCTVFFIMYHFNSRMIANNSCLYSFVDLNTVMTNMELIVRKLSENTLAS